MTAQDNVAKMEIFMETLCRFIDSRSKHNAGQESFKIKDSELTIKQLSDRLNSTHDNLRVSKSRIQSAWEHFPYKGFLAFIFLIVLMLSSFLTQFYGIWWLGLVGLLSVPLSVYFFTTSGTSSTRFKKNWIYTSYLKLRLKLWKIPPPAPDNDMLNPKCIYIPLNKNQVGTWGEWLSAVILQKLQSELGITDMKGLESTIKNAECSLNDFQKYSLWVDSVMGPLGNVPLWCFWSLGVVGLLIIGALYHESDIAKVISLSGVAAFIKIIYGFVKSNKENVEPDIEANVNIFDVICRLHRVINNETIFFAVVTNEYNIFNEIPVEYRRYTKFFIICDSTISVTPSPHYYSFNMDWLQYNEKDSAKDLLADITFSCIIDKRFITKSEEDENLLEFLRLLYKINNDNNTVLTTRSMLYLIDPDVSVLYSDTDPGSLDLTLCLFRSQSIWSAREPHFDLQATGPYSMQTKFIIEKLRIKTYTYNLPKSSLMIYLDDDDDDDPYD